MRKYIDDFGVFMTAAAPLWDSQGKVIGFVAVDFDAKYFEMYKRKFYQHVVLALIVASILSVVIAVMTYKRIKSIEETQDEQFKMAITDQLTGAYNRHYIEELSRSSLERHELERESFAILLVDFDHFKEINDKHGHQAGDLVLKRSVEQIKTVLRTADEVIRWGGEEFLIFLPDTGQRQAIEIAERLRQIIEYTLLKSPQVKN